MLWYTIFVIGYRLRSLRFVRGGETNEPCPRARSYYYSGRHRRNYLVFRLQMSRWQEVDRVTSLLTPVKSLRYVKKALNYGHS